MSSSRSRTLLCALIGVAGCGGPPPDRPAVDPRPAALTAGAHRLDVADASEIGLVPIELTAGAVYTIATSGLSAGGDTVLRLARVTYSPPLPPGAREVAWNDDVPGRTESSITYRVPAGLGGTYQVIVHARAGTPAGTCRLRVSSGAAVVKDIPSLRFGGVTLEVPRSSMAMPYRYETASPPGGIHDTVLLGLGATGALLGLDDDGGVGRASRLSGLDGVTHVVVGARLGQRGATVLYANDAWNDRDGDGLGAALEAAVGSCDSRLPPRCAVVHNLRDSDRDGLEDRAEVFGIDASPPLLLPRWGARPDHKDVFVEIDARAPQSTASITEAHAEAVRDHFAAGSAADLVNLDGTPGVRVHLDLGHDPQKASNLTLFGDWGGSNVVPAGANWRAHRRPERAGVFFHGLLDTGGQASGDGFGFGLYGGTPRAAVRILVHELGHCLNLGHQGPRGPHGGLTCSPVYPSIMNYADHAYGGPGFSTGTSFPGMVINAAALCEPAGLGGGSVAHLASFGIPTQGRAVDWNRDGVITGVIDESGQGCVSGWVRAAINWHPGVGCGARTQGEQRLSAGTSPSLARLGGWLYAFYKDAMGVPVYRRARVDAVSSTSGCPNGFAAFPGQTCTTWEPPLAVQVPNPIAIDSMSAFAASGRVYVAYKAANGPNHRAAVAGGQDPATGQLTGWTSAIVGVDLPAAAADLQLLYVDPAHPSYNTGPRRRVVAVWSSSNNQLRFSHFDPAVPGTPLFSDARPLLDLAGQPIATNGAPPTLAFWGTDDGTSTTNETWMVAPDPGSFIRIYRYVPGQDRWEDRTAAVFPSRPTGTVHQRMGFAFRPLTDGNGQVIDPRRGEFNLAYGEEIAGQIGSLWVSDVVDGARPPGTHLRFPMSTAGRFGHPWYTIATTSGGGIDLYTDPQFPHMKALLLAGDDQTLRFLPHPDGIFDADWADGSDFQVMERGICLGLRGGDAAFCGPRNSFGY